MICTRSKPFLFVFTASENSTEVVFGTVCCLPAAKKLPSFHSNPLISGVLCVPDHFMSPELESLSRMKQTLICSQLTGMSALPIDFAWTT